MYLTEKELCPQKQSWGQKEVWERSGGVKKMTSGPNCGSVGHAMVREAGGTDVPCTPSPNLSPYPDIGPTQDNWVWSGQSQRPLLGPWEGAGGTPSGSDSPEWTQGAADYHRIYQKAWYSGHILDGLCSKSEDPYFLFTLPYHFTFWQSPSISPPSYTVPGHPAMMVGGGKNRGLRARELGSTSDPAGSDLG